MVERCTLTRLLLLILIVVFQAFGQIRQQAPEFSVPLDTFSYPEEGSLLEVSAATNKAYVVLKPFGVAEIDLTTHSVRELNGSRSGLCASPDGRFVATTDTRSVLVVDTTDNSVRTISFAVAGSCDFSPDGSTLYMAAFLRESPTWDKAWAIDTTTWKVKHAWKLGIVSAKEILALPNGKAWVKTGYPDISSGLGIWSYGIQVLDPDKDSGRSVDFGQDPSNFWMDSAPDGSVYITDGVGNWTIRQIDSNTETEVKRQAGKIFMIGGVSFPSEDPQFAYLPTSFGFQGANFAAETWTVEINNESSGRVRYLRSIRQKDGTDLVCILKDGYFEAYRVTPPESPVKITAVMDAATNNPDSSHAPGEIITIIGSGFSTESSGATVLPLPTTLAKTSVKVGGVLAPLFYAGPTQINAQVPYGISGTSAKIEVITAKGTASANLSLSRLNPKVFRGPNGEFYTRAYDPWGWLNSLNDIPWISIWFSGGGITSPPVKEGEGAPYFPLAIIPAKVSVLLCGEIIDASFAGLSPGSSGLYQINLQPPPACWGQINPIPEILIYQ